MVTHAPAHVDKKRADLLRAFIDDPDIPEAFRVWAEMAVLEYRKVKDCGEVMAMSLVWSLLDYVVASPTERDLKDARGEALRARLEWQEMERDKKRARDRFKEL